MADLNTRFGALLQEKRRQRKFTQEELAQRIGLGRTSVTNIEKGRQPVTLQILFDIAQALGIPPAELLPGSGQLNPALLRHGNLIDESGQHAILKVLSNSPIERS